MSEVKIQVNGKTFVLQFGMKVFRLLSAKWNIPGLNGIFARLAIFESITDEVTFEQLDVINDLIVSAVQANEDNTETLTEKELDDLYLSDSVTMMAIVEEVFKGFIASIPQAKPVGKKKAVKK